MRHLAIAIQRLIQPLAAVFNQHVAAGNAEIGSTVSDISRNVAGADDDQTDVGMVGADNQLARLFGVFNRFNARRREQRQGFIENAPF